MKRSIPLYLLTIALLGLSVYLHSAMVAISIIALWGVHVCENIFTRKNRDQDISEMLKDISSQSKKIDSLSHDIRNVQDRAKLILGETY